MKVCVLKWLLVSIVLVFLAACDPVSDPVTPESTTKTGMFSNVEGLSYLTSSGISGVLENDTVFHYNEGDTIKFFKDDITFGEVMAEKDITVYSFPNEIIVIQILTAMDADNDSSNGFQIH